MSDANYDYEDVRVDTDQSDMALLSTLAERQRDLEDAVSAAATRLDKAKSDLREVSEVQLPELLKKCGVDTLKTSSGITVSCTEKIRASISKANTEEAHAWLEDHGFGKLIKHKVIVQFGKGDDAWAKKFMRDCAQRKKPLDLERKDGVHTQTLAAFVREELKNSGDFPEELFGVFRQTVAKISVK